MVGSATLFEVLGCIRVSEPRLDKNRHLELKTGWRAAEPCAGLFRVTDKESAPGLGGVPRQPSNEILQAESSYNAAVEWSLIEEPTRRVRTRGQRACCDAVHRDKSRLPSACEQRTEDSLSLRRCSRCLSVCLSVCDDRLYILRAD